MLAKQFFVTYTEEAIDYIVEITKGYPFFIQQFCQIIYDAVDRKEITKQDALDATDTFFKELDDGFFRSRYERCSETE